MRLAKRTVPLVVIAAGAVLVTLGIARGEVAQLMIAATNICFSCIGIG